MQKVGRIQSIWRYPVKGMAGESLRECRLDAGGLLGDRTWAVQDLARQEIQSCKFRPDLLRCRARQRLDGQGGLSGDVDVTFPDAEIRGSDDADIHRKLSSTLGHASSLQALRSFAEDAAFYRRHKSDPHTWLDELKATFAREPDEPLPDLDNLPPDMQNFVSLPGTFFLVSPVHLLTTASLQHMRELNGVADWDVERFRPNLLIETLPGMEGLVEQSWLGTQILLGDITIDCVATAPRCGAVARAQNDLPADPSILRSIVQDADQNLGMYGAVNGAALLRVGDEVWVRERAQQR